jgi:hypothetical protein
MENTKEITANSATVLNGAAALTETPAVPALEAARPARSKEPKNSKKNSVKAKVSGRERYFLAAGESGEEIVTGRELKSEQEAMVAAFQERKTFFAVTEYRVIPQFKGPAAMLVKEGVSS